MYAHIYMYRICRGVGGLVKEQIVFGKLLTLTLFIPLPIVILTIFLTQFVTPGGGGGFDATLSGEISRLHFLEQFKFEMFHVSCTSIFVVEICFGSSFIVIMFVPRHCCRFGSSSLS